MSNQAENTKAPETTATTADKMEIDRTRYQTTRSASGTKSLSNGDAVARTLEGMTIDEVFSLAKSFIGEDYREKYSHLNPGQQRMNVGNRIRGKVRKIDADNQAAIAKAIAEEKDTPKLKSGEQTLADVAAPFRKKVDEREKAAAEEKAKKAAEKEAEAKRKAEEKAAEAKRKEADAKPDNKK